MLRRLLSVCAIASLPAAIACAPDEGDFGSSEADLGAERTIELRAGESVITILATNDIHGSFASAPRFGGYVRALREHHAVAYASRQSVLLLDAGDAVQGTLASNYGEGLLAVRLMNALGYTAAVAGNHGFDFGPVDWTRDQCNSAQSSCDPLGALRRYVTEAKFPFLGANVTERATGKNLRDLPPFVLVPHEGRSIAILGLENHFTDRTTVPENVAHLAFGDGIDAVRANVEELFTTGRADIFVAVAHEGDGKPGDAQEMHDWLESLPRRSDGEPLLAAVVAGHTHAVNDAVAGETPYVQSGANGEMFGLVSLVAKKGTDGRLRIDRKRTSQKAGIAIKESKATFFGASVVSDEKIQSILTDETRVIALIANEELATTNGLGRAEGRLSDSEIGNFLADAMRKRTGATLAFINGGDVRDDIAPGVLTYEKLFRVIPKNLFLVRTPIAAGLVVKNVKLSIESCGRRGALQLSGAHVAFERDCERAEDGVDPKARLLSIVALDGKVLYRAGVGGEVNPENIDVVTTDFVMSGGAGYRHFVGLPSPLGAPLRAEVADFARDQDRIDHSAFARGRYVNCLEDAANPICPG